MNRRYLLFTLAGAFTCLLQVRAEHIDGPTNDTIKTYNLGEVIITSSTKETNDLRLLPGAISILSPQAIAARRKAAFYNDYVIALAKEAASLGIDAEELAQMRRRAREIFAAQFTGEIFAKNVEQIYLDILKGAK